MLTYVPSDGNEITALSRASIKANMAGKNDKRYYILLKDVTGTEKQKKLGILPLGDYVNFNAMMGSIYLMTPSKYDSPGECTYTSVDNDAKSITCKKDALSRLELKEFALLVAISSNNERMLTFKSSLFDKLKRAKVGDFARIEIESLNGIKSVIGAIRHIGIMKNKKGYFFGLQLEMPIGDSTGIVDGIEHFICHTNHGIFVAANRIKEIIKNSERERHQFQEYQQKHQHSQQSKASQSLPGKNAGSNHDDSKKKRYPNLQSKKKKKKEEGMKEYYPDIEVGSRVVSFDVEGKDYVAGTIRYIGQLDKHHDSAEIVIETDDVMDKASNCKLGKWTKIKQRGLVENVPREKIIVANPEGLMLEKEFLRQQVKCRNEAMTSSTDNPDGNYENLNQLIMWLADHLTTKDIEKIKFLFTSIRVGVLEKAEKPIDVLKVLQKYGNCNSKYDICDMLERIERKDLSHKISASRDKNPQEDSTPEHMIKCPQCTNIFRDAVESSCCRSVFCEECSRELVLCPICASNKMVFIPSFSTRQLVNEMMTPDQKESSLDLDPNKYQEEFKKEQEKQFNKINNVTSLPHGVVIHQPPSLTEKDPNAPNYPGKSRSNSNTSNDVPKNSNVQGSANLYGSAELKAETRSFDGAAKGNTGTGHPPNYAGRNLSNSNTSNDSLRDANMKASNTFYGSAELKAETRSFDGTAKGKTGAGHPQNYPGRNLSNSNTSNDSLRDANMKASTNFQGSADFKGSNNSFSEVTKGKTSMESTQVPGYSAQRNDDRGIAPGGVRENAQNRFLSEDPSGKLPKDNGGHGSASSYIATVQPSPRDTEEKMDLDMNYGKPAYEDHTYEEIGVRKDVLKQEEDTQHTEPTIGMMVEVVVEGTPTYGVVRWLGDVIIKEHVKYIAGLELEDYSKLATSDGVFQGQRYFTCPTGKGLFVRAKTCKPDRRFFDTVARNQMKTEIPVGSHRVQEQEVQVFETVVIQGYYPPRQKLAQKYLGFNKGIMGHHNSCYMDSTLFAMFAYTDVFDVALHRKARKNVVDEYDEVQRLLKEEIVNPLRTAGFVNRDSVLKLRKILDKHAKIPGFMSEEKDPEELFVLLFEEVLKLDPFIKLRTMGGDVNTSLLYQIFPPEIERTRYPPSIQWLLELSLIDSGLFIDEIPSVLALQMPRFGQQKMFERIFINPTLNLTSILHRIRKFCGICDQAATSVCKDCTKDAKLRDVGLVFFCDGCCDLVHHNTKREKHAPVKLPPVKHYYNENDINCEMELFAVVSINTSHYVSFVKCDDNEWVFFDSMADRKGDDQNGYNIPQVTHLNDLKAYLQGHIIEVVNLKKKVHDEKLLRFYEDASLCLYRNKQFKGYQ